MAEAASGDAENALVIHLKQTAEPRSNALETIERLSRVVSAVAIPVVLAIFGFFVQRKLQNQTVQREYVSLAVSILQETDSRKAPAGLKQWAAVMLDHNAPIKLPDDLLKSLQSGSTTLPVSGGGNVTGRGEGVSGSVAITPNVIRRGESAYLQWNSFNATSVTITPDLGKVALSGSLRVFPRQTTTYTITISNPQSSTDGTATVVVLEPRSKPDE